MRDLGQKYVNHNDHKTVDTNISGEVLQACLNLWQNVQPDSPGNCESSVLIERLMQSSPDLGLEEGEITPVQVWNIIKSLPVLESISAQTMGQVTAELCQHLKNKG
jgi:hypothetical protein